MITFGLVQDCCCSVLTDTLHKIETWCIKASDAKCQALCFPEAYLTGYFPEQAAYLSLNRTNPVFDTLSAFASKYQLDLLIGFMEQENNAFYLTHGIFRINGSRDFYRKTHLGEKEQHCFQEGDALRVYTLSCGIKIGFQICVETHFPEITQTLSLRGAEVVFAPHAHPAHSGKRKKIWQKYIPARSYDNRIYMACCNLFDGSRFFGGLYVTNPEGNVTEKLPCTKQREKVLQLP